jgi:hypothetical protein
MSDEIEDILRANYLWDEKKEIVRDVMTMVRVELKKGKTTLSRSEQNAIKEAGRSAFVLGYLEGRKNCESEISTR